MKRRSQRNACTSTRIFFLLAWGAHLRFRRTSQVKKLLPKCEGSWIWMCWMLWCWHWCAFLFVILCWQLDEWSHDPFKKNGTKCLWTFGLSIGPLHGRRHPVNRLMVDVLLDAADVHIGALLSCAWVLGSDGIVQTLDGRKDRSDFWHARNDSSSRCNQGAAHFCNPQRAGSRLCNFGQRCKRVNRGSLYVAGRVWSPEWVGIQSTRWSAHRSRHRSWEFIFGNNQSAHSLGVAWGERWSGWKRTRPSSSSGGRSHSAASE